MTALTAASVPCVPGYADTGSSFDYKYYQKSMTDVYDDLNGKTFDDRTMPIPGLIQTTFRMEGEERSSTQYIPQGMCRAGQYLLITAYDVRKKYNSVIYAVDADSMKLVSTLTMPNRFHAGGIAFRC